MYDDVWRKVSDAGSNMKKCWRGFDGGDQTCADPKIERSVVIYQAEPEVVEMKRKRKCLTNHLVHASQSKKDLKTAQILYELPTTKAQREGATPLTLTLALTLTLTLTEPNPNHRGNTVAQ